MWHTRRVPPPGAWLPDRARIVIAGGDPAFSERLRASIELHESLEVVGIAQDGAEAIQVVETLKPSVVVMDAAMPGVDGIDATRRMRELSDAPAVVLMTSEDEEIDDRAVSAGAAAYLTKGSDLGALVDVVVALAGMHTRSS